MKLNLNPSLSPSVLRRATALAEHIEQKQAELNALLFGEKMGKTVKCSRRGNTHKRTDAQRAAISEGLRRKWAERKAAEATPQPSITPS